MDAQYRILFSGKLMPGQDLQDVARRMAKKFRMREDTARQLILKGGGRVLKHDLSANAAERYRAALTAAGLVITIEPQEASSSSTDSESMLSAYPMPSAVDSVPLEKREATRSTAPPIPKATDGGWSRCPKCGAREVSDLTGVCQACGIVAARYLETHGPASATDGRAQANPYAPPQADLTPPPIDTADDVLGDPRSVSAGRGWSWILEAWDLFKDRPGAWIGAILLFYLIVIVLSLVPLVGGLATTLLGPMLSAGLMLGAHAQFRGEGVRVSHLFAGVARKPGPLALVGLVYLLFAIGIGVIVGAMLAGMMVSMGSTMDGATLDPNEMATFLMNPILALPVLFALLLGVPLAMAMFFAPALVVLNDVPVMRAFKFSFLGCLRNILPFLVFGLAAMLMILLGSLPLMLGLLLVLPILTISVYTAYRDIFYF